jgi:hypothetical protein
MIGGSSGNRVLVAISPDDSEVLYTYDEVGA